MKTIHAFISYSSKNSNQAINLTDRLKKYFGFNVFLDKNIVGGMDWSTTIIQNLKDCDFFIPLVSEHFKLSYFANQEVGIALAHNKKIIPIKLDHTNPCGFIDKIQALSLSNQANDYDPTFKVAMKLFFLSFADPYCEIYREHVCNSIIYALSRCKEFNIAKTIMRVMCHIHTFNEAHINTILNIIQENRVVRQEKYALPDLKLCLKQKYKVDI